MNTELPLRRFGPQFVAEQRQRYGKRPPENRMLSYDQAVLDEYEPWRIWLDEQLALLPEAAASAFAVNPWRDQNCEDQGVARTGRAPQADAGPRRPDGAR
ncbi:hypothetical protein ABZ572_37425 [Streptomyces sp. NPDC018338]|uniref:hypothetical protein n=1 Tax=Streptomyces sp. NPDC018338 TaxID=3157192 RepID=UPI003400D9A0